MKRGLKRSSYYICPGYPARLTTHCHDGELPRDHHLFSIQRAVPKSRFRAQIAKQNTSSLPGFPINNRTKPNMLQMTCQQ